MQTKNTQYQWACWKADYSAKVTSIYYDIYYEITSISGLPATATLNSVQNKIPDVSNLVKKADYDGKILDVEPKYFTTTDYDRFKSQTLDAKIKQKRLVDKSAITGFIINADLDKNK